MGILGTARQTLAGINVWTPLGPGGGVYVGSIAIDPSTPTTVYAHAFHPQYGGGPFKSTDGGANWSLIETGVSTTSITEIRVDPTAMPCAGTRRSARRSRSTPPPTIGYKVSAF